MKNLMGREKKVDMDVLEGTLIAAIEYGYEHNAPVSRVRGEDSDKNLISGIKFNIKTSDLNKWGYNHREIIEVLQRLECQLNPPFTVVEGEPVTTIHMGSQLLRRKKTPTKLYVPTNPQSLARCSTIT